MIGSLALMLFGAAALPCEGLTALKLDKAIVTSAEMVPEAAVPPRGGGQGRGAGNGGQGGGATPPAAGRNARPKDLPGGRGRP